MDNNNNNVTLTHCPYYDDSTKAFLSVFAFWVDGVTKMTLSIMGVIGNIISVYILARPNMRNSFNMLLISLAFIDTTYLINDGFLESIRKRFDVSEAFDDFHTRLFPHFLYPLKHIALTASIFMTVAIAFERFIAVHYPINFNLAINDPGRLKRRLLCYVMPVLTLSLAFNGTKFFESEVIYPETNDTRAEEARPRLSVTPLRTNPTYSDYTNWSRLFILGLLPFFALVTLNYQIFKDLRARKQRRMTLVARVPIKKSSPKEEAEDSLTESQKSKSLCCTLRIRRKSGKEVKKKRKAADIEVELEEDDFGVTEDDLGTTCFQMNLLNNGDSLNGSAKDSGGGAEHQEIESVKLIEAKDEASKKEAGMLKEITRVEAETEFCQGTLNGDQGEEEKRRFRFPRRKRPSKRPKKRQQSASDNDFGSYAERRMEKERRRKAEDNLATVFLGFALVFLACHAPRIFIDLHELWTLRAANECRAAGLRGFPPWSIAAINVSHVFLALNSATNILVYCGMSSKFREEFLRAFSSR